MKICIYGAGAIGGFLGVLLSRAGHEVSLIARGAHLAAMQAKGITLEMGGETLHASPACVGDPADLGPQDTVILTVKAPALPGVAAKLAPLLGPETPVVSAMNGIPWWFFHGFAGGGGKFKDLRLASVDPEGALAKAIHPERIIGCVMHVACSVPEPGVIRHAAQNRFFFGEPSGADSERGRRLVDAMAGAGVGATWTDEIQQKAWLKLLGNLTFAPISLLTGATAEQMAHDPAVREVCARMIDEANRVGERFGLEPGMATDKRIELGASLGAFKTSMLQDLEKRRPVELDTIVKAVIEMGRTAGAPTPTIDTVFALAARSAALAGVYDG